MESHTRLSRKRRNI